MKHIIVLILFLTISIISDADTVHFRAGEIWYNVIVKEIDCSELYARALIKTASDSYSSLNTPIPTGWTTNFKKIIITTDKTPRPKTSTITTPISTPLPEHPLFSAYSGETWQIKQANISLLKKPEAPKIGRASCRERV